MPTRRFLSEALILIGTVGGALIGYSAGANLEPHFHMILAFVGMGAGGAFADLCLKGGR